MSGDFSLREALLERLLPVAATPHRGPARVHRHYQEPSVGRHLYQPRTELRDRDPGDCATKSPTSLTPPHRLTADLSRMGEVQVLDGDRSAARDAGQVQDLADGSADPPVTGWGGHPVQIQRDGVGSANRISVPIHHPAGQMPGVEVDRDYPADGRRMD